MLQPIITKELQNLLVSNKKIKEVHFDEYGNHHLNVFKLKAHKLDDTHPKDYGLYVSGVVCDRKLIPGSDKWDTGLEKGIYEPISMGAPNSKIAKTMSREEVLAVDLSPKEESMLTRVSKMSPDEIEALKAVLGVNSEKPSKKTKEDKAEDIKS
jgi:hypothetical protein